MAEARDVLASGHRIDLAVIDLGLPDGYGAELIGGLRAATPRAQALVPSATEDRAEIARAVELGAAGLLHKASSMGEVLDAVRRLRAGETILPLGEVVESLRPPRRPQGGVARGAQGSRAVVFLCLDPVWILRHSFSKRPKASWFLETMWLHRRTQPLTTHGVCVTRYSFSSHPE